MYICYHETRSDKYTGKTYLVDLLTWILIFSFKRIQLIQLENNDDIY